MLEMVGEKLKGHDRLNYSGSSKKEHNEHEAEQLLLKGLKKLGMREEDLDESAKGDVRKRVLAYHVRSRTMICNRWLSERLKMGCPSNISGYLRSVHESSDVRTKKMLRLLRP